MGKRQRLTISEAHENVSGILAELRQIGLGFELGFDPRAPRHPVFLVAGKIKAGKSSLINDMLGEEHLLPGLFPRQNFEVWRDAGEKREKDVALAKVKEMNLDIKMLATDHGVIWRTHIDKILQAYDEWMTGGGNVAGVKAD